jgi:hypothetical protein
MGKKRRKSKTMGKEASAEWGLHPSRCVSPFSFLKGQLLYFVFRKTYNFSAS